MNQEIKQKWIDALNSGEYQQGRLMLRTKNNDFCCLGVLCDLYSKEKGAKWSIDGDKMLGYEILTESAYLPQAVKVWAELMSGTKQENLVNSNDNDYKSFAEIAEYIKREL